MINCRSILILILLIAFSYTNSSLAKMYKWTDDNGVTHFSDTRPPDEKQSHEIYETSAASPNETELELDEKEADANHPDNSLDPEEMSDLTTADIIGKWKHIGVSTQLSAPQKPSKPYKPQSWEFKNDGTVVYTIGDKTNRFPYKIQGKQIITTPFPNQKKSFVVVKMSYDKMIWKDPDWESYVHITRVY